MTERAPTKRIRTGVVGCGYWGKNLVRHFAALSDLRACCDTADEVRRRIGSAYPETSLTASADELIESDLDAVVIATPAPTHAELALRALAAGKHVFVEKPLALSAADAARVVDAAESSGRIVMVGHLLEYHPAVVYLKQLIDRGELGEVYYLYSQRVNLGKLRADENALWSLAPHDVSVLLYLLGEEPEEVTATGQAFLQPDVEDVVFATLKFASGRMAHLQVSWLDPHKERRLTVVGSRKMAVFDDMQPQEKVRLYDKGVDRHPGEASPYASYGDLLALREGDIHIPRIPMTEPLALECSAFLDAIVSGEQPRTDVRDGERVVRVLEAASASLERNRFRFTTSPPDAAAPEP